MYKILEFLHGKKAIILGVSGAVLIYLTKETVISGNLAMLLQTILAILGGGADVATGKLMGVRKLK